MISRFLPNGEAQKVGPGEKVVSTNKYSHIGHRHILERIPKVISTLQYVRVGNKLGHTH